MLRGCKNRMSSPVWVLQDAENLWVSLIHLQLEPPRAPQAEPPRAPQPQMLGLTQASPRGKPDTCPLCSASPMGTAPLTLGASWGQGHRES